MASLSRLLLADGYMGPIRLKSKSFFDYSGSTRGDSSYYDMRFIVGGGIGEVLTHIRPDGTVIWMQPATSAQVLEGTVEKTPDSADEAMLWIIFRRLNLSGNWRLDHMNSSSGGAGAVFYKLVNGLRVVNINPSWNYSVFYGYKTQTGSVGGNPDLPPVSNPTPSISYEEARQKLQTYYEETKFGIFDPKWPYKVVVRPELAYYKFSNEPEARLIWVPRIYEILDDGTEIFNGDYNHFVDARSGEIVKADDPCWM